MDIIALRSFGLSYIIMDSIFIVAFCLLLFFTKRRLSLIFALCGGLLYFIVDYGIFHLATGSRHIVNADMFWVLLWMSFSYGITNFAWIWLCLRRDEKLTEWTLLIVLWWIVCPILDDAITGGGQQITIWRETGAYHWFMAVFLIVSYVALIVWNLFQKDKNKQFKLLWLFVIGVAVQFGWEVTLLLGGSVTAATFSLSGFFSLLAGAFVGAMAVMSLILFFSLLIRSNVMLLITGIMIGYLASSAVALLNYVSTAEGVQSYMLWGMGNFGGVSLSQMPWFALVALIGIVAALSLVKPLNALLLGERYAENLGIHVRRVRNVLLVITGLLTAVTTAFCGPILFIDLAVPHIARLLLGTSNHRILLPMTLLTGAVVALLCNLVCVLPGSTGFIPLNSVTPIIGAPVVIYVILSGRSRE